MGLQASASLTLLCAPQGSCDKQHGWPYKRGSVSAVLQKDSQRATSYCAHSFCPQHFPILCSPESFLCNSKGRTKFKNRNGPLNTLLKFTHSLYPYPHFPPHLPTQHLRPVVMGAPLAVLCLFLTSNKIMPKD